SGSYQLSATVAADRKKATTGTAVAVALPHPAYALVEINQPRANVELSIKVLQPGSSLGESKWADSELLRLILLIAFGAGIYCITAYLFRMPELEKFVDMVKRKLGRSKPATASASTDGGPEEP